MSLRASQLCTSIQTRAQSSGSVRAYKEPPLFTGTNSLDALKHVVYEIQKRGSHKLLFHASQRFVAIYDQFPKSKYHLLILPRERYYESVHHIEPSNRADMQFLTEMVRFGDEVIHSLLRQIDPNRTFISGFHAIPSLQPVHMHVLSLDLSGRSMKKKKHFNSFATPFFLESHQTLRQLQSGSRITTHKEEFQEMLKRPMQCFWCDSNVSDIDAWRSHYRACSEAAGVM